MAPFSPEIVCAGELLIDLLSTDYADTFREADHYRRYPGGSPANLAMNLARLGSKVGLLATVGRDDAGKLLLDELVAAGVDTAAVHKVTEPTTMVLVTKSRATSQFEVYRSADVHIGKEQLPDDYLTETQIFHTTAFALSREPARSAIMDLARTAVSGGARLSIDLNYAAKVWPDRLDALWTLSQYVALGQEAGRGSLVKCSDVDYQRLFDEAPETNLEAGERLRDFGAGVVCLTLGEKGCYVLGEKEEFELPSRPVTVRDTTGAGDAFWSGFLAAYAVGRDLHTCAMAGRAMAERKLTTVGPLRESVTLDALLG